MYMELLFGIRIPTYQKGPKSKVWNKILAISAFYHFCCIKEFKYQPLTLPIMQIRRQLMYSMLG